MNTKKATLERSRFAAEILRNRESIEATLRTLPEYASKSAYATIQLRTLMAALTLAHDELVQIECALNWHAYDNMGTPRCQCHSLLGAVSVASQYDQGYVVHKTFGI